MRSITSRVYTWVQLPFCSNAPRHPITALLATLRILFPEPLNADARLSVYPVPVQHEMQIAVPEGKEGSMVVTLLDSRDTGCCGSRERRLRSMASESIHPGYR